MQGNTPAPQPEPAQENPFAGRFKNKNRYKMKDKHKDKHKLQNKMNLNYLNKSNKIESIEYKKDNHQNQLINKSDLILTNDRSRFTI